MQAAYNICRYFMKGTQMNIDGEIVTWVSLLEKETTETRSYEGQQDKKQAPREILTQWQPGTSDCDYGTYPPTRSTWTHNKAGEVWIWSSHCPLGLRLAWMGSCSKALCDLRIGTFLAEIGHLATVTFEGQVGRLHLRRPGEIGNKEQKTSITSHQLKDHPSKGDRKRLFWRYQRGKLII